MTGDDRLETVLRSIGEHLEVPPQPELDATFAAPSRRRPPALLAVAAAVALIVIGVVVVPSTRAAVADWLGIGSTRIQITGEDAVAVDLPHIAEGLSPISIDEAEQLVGRTLPDTSGTSLGPPDAVYQMPEGGVLLAWEDDEASLWIRADTDAGIVFDKLVGSGQGIEAVDDLGRRALLVTGAHILQTPQRRIAARSVVLWTDDTHEYRLEADLDGAVLVDLARSVS